MDSECSLNQFKHIKTNIIKIMIKIRKRKKLKNIEIKKV